MLALVLIRTMLIWAGWYYASSLLLHDAPASALTALVKLLSIYAGLPFAASVAVALSNAKKAAIPLVSVLVLATYPFSAMTDLAATVAPVGIGLVIGNTAR